MMIENFSQQLIHRASSSFFCHHRYIFFFCYTWFCYVHQTLSCFVVLTSIKICSHFHFSLLCFARTLFASFRSALPFSVVHFIYSFFRHTAMQVRYKEKEKKNGEQRKKLHKICKSKEDEKLYIFVIRTTKLASLHNIYFLLCVCFVSVLGFIFRLNFVWLSFLLLH